MVRIALIGAGQIGSRHLQALAHLPEAEIWIYDVSEASLQVALERFQQVSGTTNFVGTCHPVTDMAAFPAEVDVAFITTTAQHRRQAFDQMLLHTKPRFLVFEKVLFQRIQDLEDVKAELHHRGIPAYVNFPRRQYPVYQQLRQSILADHDRSIQLQVTGGQWGLACNGLHFIDLFSFVTGSETFEMDAQGLAGVPFESKRAGFFEVNGTLRVTDDHGNSMALSCLEEPFASNVSITTTKRWITISEGVAQPMQVSGKANDGWKAESAPCIIPYQSQLSHLVVQDLMKTGACDLPSYDEALAPHAKFLSTLLTHFRTNMGWEHDYCPIT